jgi:hypothetical protein
MKNMVFLITLLAFAIPSWVVAEAAVDVVVFNESFTRNTGTPETITRSFPAISGTAVIEVWNGSASDSTVGKVSSSTISVNGLTVVGTSNFNQKVTFLENTIGLTEGNNTISVLLKSKPGGTILIKIVQTVEGEAERKLPLLIFSDALSRGDTAKALSFVKRSRQSDFAELFSTIGSVGMEEISAVIETATPVLVGEDFAEYKGSVPLASGEVILAKFTLTKTTDGWKIDRL